MAFPESFEDRLGIVFERTLPKLGPEARAQLQAIIEPQSLAIIAGVLVAWVVSHAFGVGEIIDIVLLVAGVLAIGLAVFTGVDELYEFASGTYLAKTDGDLDQAADHLAQAIAILGIQAVLAILFKGARAPKGPKLRVTPGSGPRGPGGRYRPTTTTNSALAAGEGSTTFFGNIVVSTRGAATDRELVLLHERVHQFLAPKLYRMRDFRVENRMNSYFNSSLWRYVEEALAETIAQVGVRGMQKFFIGVRFPVRHGYVRLMQGGGYSPLMKGAGVLPEAGSLLARGIVLGISYSLWFTPDAGTAN